MMAKVFFNTDIKGKGKVWVENNGLNRPTLVLVVNEKDFPEGLEETKLVENAKIGYLIKGKHAFIFVNKSNKASDTIVGVFLNRAYGYGVLNEDTELFSYSSYGGAGESKFGIYKIGAIIKEYSYKNRRPNNYWILTENGWKKVGTEADVMANVDVDEDARKIAETIGLLEEIKYIE